MLVGKTGLVLVGKTGLELEGKAGPELVDMPAHQQAPEDTTDLPEGKLVELLQSLLEVLPVLRIRSVVLGKLECSSDLCRDREAVNRASRMSSDRDLMMPSRLIAVVERNVSYKDTVSWSASEIRVLWQPSIAAWTWSVGWWWGCIPAVCWRRVWRRSLEIA